MLTPLSGPSVILICFFRTIRWNRRWRLFWRPVTWVYRLTRCVTRIGNITFIFLLTHPVGFAVEIHWALSGPSPGFSSGQVVRSSSRRGEAADFGAASACPVSGGHDFFTWRARTWRTCSARLRRVVDVDRIITSTPRFDWHYLRQAARTGGSARDHGGGTAPRAPPPRHPRAARLRREPRRLPSYAAQPRSAPRGPVDDHLPPVCHAMRTASALCRVGAVPPRRAPRRPAEVAWGSPRPARPCHPLEEVESPKRWPAHLTALTSSR